ncbi:MAG: hypothetical protein P8M34_14135 [Saprospiraceae bacterium]|nr:hypothetical protein [Saprospiraceae bacterium]|tara:strand:- start:4977 stop:6017 length:1041 start_codon:yes stop_codon:yes gene_type:complete
MCWDPGHEYREDKDSLKAAAANGGFTKVFVWSNTDPIIDNKAQYQYYTNDNGPGNVGLYPICSITKKTEGKELAELIDLHQSGALLFSDGLTFNGPIKELRKAMEYSKSMKAKVLYAPSPFDINPEGQIHESDISISLGLPGLPGVSETMSIQKAISIAEYAETDFVLHNISTKYALDIVKSSAVFALGVSYFNLCKDVRSCSDFDANHKVIPPLRDEDDKKELVKAVKSNQITYISSNHYPLENDVKDMEFGLASFGASGIETVFSALIMDTDIELESIISKLTYGPASVGGVSVESIKEDAAVNLTIFDPKAKWIYNDKTCQSKCRNSPFYGKELTGKILGVVI